MRLPAALLLMSLTLAAAPGPEIPLWPAAAPGAPLSLPPEADTSKPGERPVAGLPVIRLGNVSVPTLKVYKPAKDKDTGAAVVVFPGGGYSILAMNLEGTEICEWLNSIGVTGILVKYRVPARANLPRGAAPLQDAQRALGLVRANAKAWAIDPARVGVLGFSAGGHLSAAVSTNYAKRTYDPVDAADAESCRPDFTVLVYPAYLAVKEDHDKLAADIPVDAQTPPAFIVQTEDDSVRVENAITYFTALKAAKVQAELHIFPTGGHGYGLRPSEHKVTTWPSLVEQWLRARGLLKR